MFETIVWATDGSELADRALPYVTELSRVHGSKIVAVHANELLHGRYGGAPLLADEPDLREKIERQVEKLRTDGFDATLELATGSGDVAALIHVRGGGGQPAPAAAVPPGTATAAATPRSGRTGSSGSADRRWTPTPPRPLPRSIRSRTASRRTG